MSESLREERPHDGITGEQQTSTQQAQGDVELHTDNEINPLCLVIFKQILFSFHVILLLSKVPR